MPSSYSGLNSKFDNTDQRSPFNRGDNTVEAVVNTDNAPTTYLRRPWDPLRFPAHYDKDDPIQERPADLRLNVRFYQLNNLTWMAWGTDGADGSGTESHRPTAIRVA